MIERRPNCIIIEDDLIVTKYIETIIENELNLFIATNSKEAMELLSIIPFDVAIIDIRLPDISGHQMIKKIKQIDSRIQTIVTSSSNDIEDAIEAFRRGAIDFLPKPIDEHLLRRSINKALKLAEISKINEQVSSEISKTEVDLIVGNSGAIEGLKNAIQKLRKTDTDILITGESGTGKELVARTLHNQEHSVKRPYVTLNCSAIPTDLIESVLFGHEKGAFTGAYKKQLGKFELAHGGDIFLDEIGTLPFHLQSKLLRVLQEREIEPVGSSKTKKIDFRVIAATNEDLIELVRKNRFRADLFFRLNKITLRVPPLREHKEDIPILVEHFLKKHARNNQVKTMTSKAIELLQTRDWPGNIRELENYIENLIITTTTHLISDSYIISRGEINLTPETDSKTIPGHLFGSFIDYTQHHTLDNAVRYLEQDFIIRVLDKFPTKREAAARLGIDRKTLFRKIKLYDIE